MKSPALLLLAVAALSGCISDSLEDGAVLLQYSKLFEAGRRAEYEGDVKIAEDTYGWLIGRDNRYGEYGLAMLELRRKSGCVDGVSHLISCANRSGSDFAMDSAFSAAAMIKLSDVAVAEHGRPDVAASLRGMASLAITPQVRAWAEEMKADADTAAIYRDVISAVESIRQSGEYAKTLTWGEIREVFLDGESGNCALGGEK